MATSYTNTHPQFTVVKNGSFSPNADGEVEFFTVGNTGDANRKDTYNVPEPDATPTVAQTNPNPMPLDGDGRTTFPVFLIGTYNTVIRDSAGNQIDTTDNVLGSDASGTTEITVDNVAELRAVDTNNFKSAFVQGTTTIDDGGQTHFYYSAGSAVSDNGTTVIEPTVGGGRWLILNVETLTLGDDAVTYAKMQDIVADNVLLGNTTGANQTVQEVTVETAMIDNSAVTTAKIADRNVTGVKLGFVPANALTGLDITNGTATTTDIDVAVGAIGDSTGAVLMDLTSIITKEIDNPWAEGTTAGGYASASGIATNTWYRVFLIMKTDGTVDCGFDTSETAANLLAAASAYTYYRRIGWVKTDGSSQIINWVFGGHREYVWLAPYDMGATISTSRTTATGQVPPSHTGLFAYRILSQTAAGSTAGYGILTQVGTNDSTPGALLFSAYAYGSATVAGISLVGAGGSGMVSMRTNSSSQINNRESSSVASGEVINISWTDDLNRG